LQIQDFFLCDEGDGACGSELPQRQQKPAINSPVSMKNRLGAMETATALEDIPPIAWLL
jgi:hypothetical protein